VRVSRRPTRRRRRIAHKPASRELSANDYLAILVDSGVSLSTCGRNARCHKYLLSDRARPGPGRKNLTLTISPQADQRRALKSRVQQKNALGQPGRQSHPSRFASRSWRRHAGTQVNARGRTAVKIPHPIRVSQKCCRRDLPRPMVHGLNYRKGRQLKFVRCFIHGAALVCFINRRSKSSQARRAAVCA
jgi:hypothetical protein